MAKRWVDVKLMNYNHSFLIVEFLTTVANKSRQFKIDDIVNYNSKLGWKSADRYLRDLRTAGQIKYEVADRHTGLYQLTSTYSELIKTKQIVSDKGYWIDEATPVVVSNGFAFPVEQQGLF